MNFKKVVLMYFSPNGTTKQTLENIAKGINCDEIEKYDLTTFNKRWQYREFGEDALVIVGVPTYEGRAVPTAKEMLSRTKANNTPCVAVVTYGNREYEDSLLELKDMCTNSGFKVFAGAAFIAQHSVNIGVGANRPDGKDEAIQINFGRQIEEKLKKIINIDDVEVSVKGNYPYRYVAETPIAPTLKEGFEETGFNGYLCPVRAIDPKDNKRVDNFRCILCQKCINESKNNALEITIPKYQETLKMLKAITIERKEPEIFI